MKNLLFPHILRPIGWIMFIPAIIVGALLLFNVFSSTIANDLVIIFIAIGSLFIVCSKEMIEDEMTKSIRLSSLLNSIYVYVILLILCTIFINGFHYLTFLFINLVLLPIIFVCNFRWEMHRYNKLSEDEEQN